MSVQDEITTRRAKSIVLNHWIYNFLPFGAIFSGIRLSSFTPIVAWSLTWMTLWSISSSVSRCDGMEYRVEQLLCIKRLAEEDTERYEPDRSFINQDDYNDWLTSRYRRLDEGAVAKEFFDLLMSVNVPGIIGGIASAATIKAARRQQKTDFIL